MSKLKENYGNKIPLKRINVPSDKPAMVKATPWSERIASYHRQGSPFTRQGSFNGQRSGLTQGTPSSLNPKLVINKALLAPPKLSPMEASPQKPRKRGPDGKFAQAQSVGVQSAAMQDKEAAERIARLRASKQKQDLSPSVVNLVAKKAIDCEECKPEKPCSEHKVDKAMSLAGGGDPSSSMQNLYGNSNGKPIGTSSRGLTIYDDPYHPEHKEFSPEDHMEAAGLHQQLSQNSLMQGNQVAGMQHQQHSSLHEDLANESKLPMERFLEQNYAGGGQGTPGANPQQAGPSGYSGPDPADSFLDPMHQEDQGKPVFQDRFSQGPKPGMMDTRTGGPVGPQTQQMGHAGTLPQQESMPSEPPSNAGSMPVIEGQKQQQEQEYGEPAATAPFGGADDESASKKETGKQVTKSLELWLSKRR